MYEYYIFIRVYNNYIDDFKKNFNNFNKYNKGYIDLIYGKETNIFKSFNEQIQKISLKWSNKSYIFKEYDFIFHFLIYSEMITKYGYERLQYSSTEIDKKFMNEYFIKIKNKNKISYLTIIIDLLITLFDFLIENFLICKKFFLILILIII